MPEVTLTNHYGNREILPGTLWPGLTRYNRAIGSWKPILDRVLSPDMLDQNGVLLGDPDDSHRDLESLVDVISSKNASNRLLRSPKQLAMIRKQIGHCAITEDGCWVAGSSLLSLREATELDTSHVILEKDQDHTEVRMCSTPECIYHRHYDVTLNVPSGRRELVYPNPNYYQQDGPRIITAWGDSLPSVDKSRQALYEFQHRSVPFVPVVESVLTAGGVSQISLLPHTGCWFVRSYYMTPTGQSAPKGWQYDGYGRLKIPGPAAEKYKYAKYSTLAHRIVWLLHTGVLKDPKKFVLNHRCGFRPCCNPGHLEELTPQQNNVHGIMMDITKNIANEVTSLENGLPQLIQRSKALGKNPVNITDFWDV